MGQLDGCQATRQVLVISSHAVLAKAIEAAVRAVAMVSVMTVRDTGRASPRGAGPEVKPDLIILTDLSSKADPALTRQLVRALEGLQRVPVLVICEQPAPPRLRDSQVHYATFPFDPHALRERVERILCNEHDGGRGEANAGAGRARPRVLIVEDERIVAETLETTLDALGYQVVGSHPLAEQAVQAVHVDRPDLVLIDTHLKGPMDGIEAARLIQAKSDVPVVYLSAHTDADTLKRAMLTAPYGYILKPFEERELHSTVEIALQRARAERQARESERWMRALVESAADGVIATNAEGRVVLMNPVAEALTGLPQHASIGRPLGEVFHVQGTGSGGDPSRGPEGSGGGIVTVKSGDGSELLVDYTVSSMRDRDGAVQGQVLALRDVTERIQAQAVLRRQAEALAVRNEELAAFAHTVAHDIKDPLNVVYGYASLLISDWGGLSDTLIREGLRTIAEFSHRTANIVDELMLLATVLDAVVLPEPLSMPEIIAQAEARLTDMQQRTRASIRLACDTWPLALGYAPWIEEVWVNYLSNAMKYGGSPPVLELGAERVGTNVRFWVRDNGPGIKAEDQKQLFVPFTRLHQVRVTGQGLGLSIVSRIVSRLGGEVGVDSEPGAGSTFYFTLPACKGTATAQT